ncbi:hypothetical protein GGX14DRAFT_573697 [Mycena pura]|uniref:Uncharacterized protein n=1 Tax=Mycena pura TaxID=153505 RepID=A0AAD6V2S8_9AGAR|nr:hypothetical protein GGX14DRAFT_573697 [Mycena pura]
MLTADADAQVAGDVANVDVQWGGGGRPRRGWLRSINCFAASLSDPASSAACGDREPERRALPLTRSWEAFRMEVRSRAARLDLRFVFGASSLAAPSSSVFCLAASILVAAAPASFRAPPHRAPRPPVTLAVVRCVIAAPLSLEPTASSFLLFELLRLALGTALITAPPHSFIMARRRPAAPPSSFRTVSSSSAHALAVRLRSVDFLTHLERIRRLSAAFIARLLARLHTHWPPLLSLIFIDCIALHALDPSSSVIRACRLDSGAFHGVYNFTAVLSGSPYTLWNHLSPYMRRTFACHHSGYSYSPPSDAIQFGLPLIHHLVFAFTPILITAVRRLHRLVVCTQWHPDLLQLRRAQPEMVLRPPLPRLLPRAPPSQLPVRATQTAATGQPEAGVLQLATEPFEATRARWWLALQGPRIQMNNASYPLEDWNYPQYPTQQQYMQNTYQPDQYHDELQTYASAVQYARKGESRPGDQ